MIAIISTPFILKDICSHILGAIFGPSIVAPSPISTTFIHPLLNFGHLRVLIVNYQILNLLYLGSLNGIVTMLRDKVVLGFGEGFFRVATLVDRVLQEIAILNGLEFGMIQMGGENFLGGLCFA